MKWGDPYTHPSAKDLPLGLQEAISRYDALKAYTNFKLGAGIDFNLYLNNEMYRNTIIQNFNDITPGNELKQQSLMNSKGVLNFDGADKVIAQLRASGLTIYGHNLVWHNQQQAAYLNSLIAPTVIPGTPGSSLIINGDFEDGLNGWNIPYYAENVSVTTNEAIDGTHSMKVEVGDFGGSKYNIQINGPAFPIINGHKYEISFFIKSDGEGQIGLDFPNKDLTNQYPWTEGQELASTTSVWTKITYNPTATPDGMVATTDNNSMNFRLLLGAMKNVTYYIDGVEVVDLDAATEVNYVENGDFESGEIDPWTVPNKGAGVTVTADAKYNGNYGLQGISGETSKNDWDLQFQSVTMNLDVDKTYTCSFWVKSDIPGKGRISFNGKINDGSASGNQYPYLNWDGAGTGRDFATSSIWKLISFDIKPFSSTLQLSFDFGQVPDVTYFFDDVKVVEKAAATSQSSKNLFRSGPVTIDKTPEEKAAILDSVLVNYIDAVASHYKGAIAAWDVVNEPMDENGAVRAGTEDLTQISTFYWSYYLGKDYGVTAFKTARVADPDAKLFINDYNLETPGGTKLQGLINYVQYIEEHGAKVDGIGTQLHISLTTDTTAIDKMFQTLAITKKLIKISEMDIKIGSSSPTADQYAAQANMYRFVVSSFIRNIPEAQRYGITVWCVSDNPEEHVNWIPDDAPCLFDANYARKHAYKGFADGLAGKDISADFSGDLVY